MADVLWQKMFDVKAGSTANSDKEELPYHCDPSQLRKPSVRRSPYDGPLDEPTESTPRMVAVNGRGYPWEVLIQPHTDAGGDAYYIGDAYQDIKCEAGEDGWGRGVDLNAMPYLSYVKRVSQKSPHLEYLAHWMQVSAAPPKWKFLKNYPDHVLDRAQRTHVCVLDFDHDNHLTGRPVYNDCASLSQRIHNEDSVQTRLIVVEDLSRDVVELLGGFYDVDPLFFLSHLSDYLFNNTRDRWVELPDLDVMARDRPHFHLEYLRPRYFKNPEAFEKAEYETGLFNVLRRLDSDRSAKRLQNSLLDLSGACVTLTRAKTSLWLRKPRQDKKEPLVAILLVDPSVTNGNALWHGYRPFEETPSMHDTENHNEPQRTTLFEDVVHWSSKLNQNDFAAIERDPRCLGIPMYRIVLAEWRTVLKYMMGMLGKIEWEFENPHWGERPNDIDDSLRKLSPWRRNVPYYHNMIADSISRLFPPHLVASVHRGDRLGNIPLSHDIASLLSDFLLVQRLLNECQNRIERIQTVATNSINIEESRRAVKQNMHLARLTFLATIFIPLSFTTSFLSMSPGFLQDTQSIWLFFALGIPLTCCALLIVDLSHPTDPYVKRKWRQLRGIPADPSRGQVASKKPKQTVAQGETIKWDVDMKPKPVTRRFRLRWTTK